MSLSAMLFGSGSKIHKITNILGLGIPSLLNKAFMGKDPKMAAITLGELSQQTAKEGEPRPIAYGICRPIGANVIYQSQPIRRMVKTYVGKAGGKGGSKEKKQYQDVEHVYRYYALRVCEGPITGYRRIWRNGTLVYDARKGSAWGAKNNHLFFNSYRLYTGGWDQMPDPAMQSMLKTTDIPAFRGTAYLMAVNEDLTDFGGAIPQWQFEVVRSEGYYLTSRPYALEDTPSSGAVAVGAKQSPSTSVSESSSVVSVGVKGPPFTVADPENMNATGGVDRIVMIGAHQYAATHKMNATGGVDRIVMIPAVKYTVEPHEMNATGGVDRVVMTRTIA